MQSYYYAGRADKKFGRAGEITLDFQTGFFGQFITPTYSPSVKILGATPSFSLTLYPGWNGSSAKLDVGMTSESGSDAVSGFGDIYPAAQLFWNEGSHNWMAYLTGGIPVGDYDPTRLSNLGLGHAAIDVGGAYTYLNTSNGWEFSATGGLTYNLENPHTHYTSGIDTHVDIGVSRFFSEQFFLGAVGYAYVQITPDNGQPPELGNFEGRSFAVGPQLGYNFMEDGVALYTNLRAYVEFGVENRPQGGSLFLTVDIPVSAIDKR